MSSLDLPAEYQTAEGLRTLANFLRSQNGVKSRSGIEHEKRVDYFKGEQTDFIRYERHLMTAASSSLCEAFSLINIFRRQTSY